MFMRWKADPRPQSLTVYLLQWDRNCFGLLASDIKKPLKPACEDDYDDMVVNICNSFLSLYFEAILCLENCAFNSQAWPHILWRGWYCRVIDF